MTAEILCDHPESTRHEPNWRTEVRNLASSRIEHGSRTVCNATKHTGLSFIISGTISPSSRIQRAHHVCLHVTPVARSRHLLGMDGSVTVLGRMIKREQTAKEISFCTYFSHTLCSPLHSRLLSSWRRAACPSRPCQWTSLLSNLSTGPRRLGHLRRDLPSEYS